MNTSINTSKDPNKYLAAIAVPIDPQPPEAIATDCHVSRWYLVGEYSDMRTASEYAYKAALKHKADSYNVLFPDSGADYAEAREKLRASRLPDFGNYISNQ